MESSRNDCSVNGHRNNAKQPRNNPHALLRYMLKIHHQASFAQNYSHHLDMQYCLYVGFLTILLFWDLDHAKIYKFDLQIRGLVLKLASQTASRIRAIWSFHLVVSRERLRNIPKRDTHARSVQSICCRLSILLFCGVPVAVVLTYASRHSQNLNLELRLSLFLL